MSEEFFGHAQFKGKDWDCTGCDFWNDRGVQGHCELPNCIFDKKRGSG